MAMKKVPCNCLPYLLLATLLVDSDGEDQRLMLRVRDLNDHAALADLLRRLQNDLRRTLSRHLPSAEVDDGLAEVHLRIWLRRQQYCPCRGAVRGWARAIARFYSCDWLRQHRRHPLVNVPLHMLPLADTQPDPSLAAEQTEQVRKMQCLLEKTLAEFPVHVRVSFQQRLLGASYAAIAHATGLPRGTVASSVFRIRARLFAVLGKFKFPVPIFGEQPMSTSKDSAGKEQDNNEITQRLTALEQEVQQRQEDPQTRAVRLYERLDCLIGDPRQHQSETDWAEVFDLLDGDDGLRPVRKHLRRGLYTAVAMRLKEARELLREVPHHRVAISQMRQVQNHLLEATGFSQ